MDLKKLFEILGEKNTKNTLYNIFIVFLIGIFIVIVASFFKNKNETQANGKIADSNEVQIINNKYDTTLYEQRQKEELKNILSKIEGVGNVDVMIYFESGEEQVPAVDVNRSVSTTEENDNSGGKRQITQNNDGSKVVIANTGNSNEPLILKRYKPKVTGVIIVAEGAEDGKIQYEMTKAVANFYNIPDNKVNVYSMKR